MKSKPKTEESGGDADLGSEEDGEDLTVQGIVSRALPIQSRKTLRLNGTEVFSGNGSERYGTTNE